MTTPRDILGELRAANIARNALWDKENMLVGVVGALFFSNELGGECGEAQNVIKKLVRRQIRMRGSTSSPEALAEELADVIIVCDLLANFYHIDLRSSIINKHNLTSDRVGLPRFLEPWQ